MPTVGASSGSHSAPGTCVFKDTHLRTRISASRTEREVLVGPGERGHEVRGLFTEPQRPAGSGFSAASRADARSAFTRLRSHMDEVRPLSLRHSSLGQGGGPVPPGGGQEQPGSASPAWPPRRGFHSRPTTGRQGYRENACVSAAGSLSHGDRSGEAAGERGERGSAVRSCWCAWTVAEAGKGSGLRARSLFRLPNADVLFTRACLWRRVCGLWTAERSGSPSREAVGWGTALWEPK